MSARNQIIKHYAKKSPSICTGMIFPAVFLNSDVRFERELESVLVLNVFHCVFAGDFFAVLIRIKVVVVHDADDTFFSPVVTLYKVGSVWKSSRIPAAFMKSMFLRDSRKVPPATLSSCSSLRISFCLRFYLRFMRTSASFVTRVEKKSADRSRRVVIPNSKFQIPNCS